MKEILFITLAVVILFSATRAAADDCGYIDGTRVCWNSGTSTILSWTYAKSTTSGYQIEVRDFNWLGSVVIKVTKNNDVREGIVSEGESYTFDFTNGSGFEGVKIIGEKISNINAFPPNIGTYPTDPQAKITIKTPEAEIKKTPSLNVVISTEGEAAVGSRIIANIRTQNSGDADLLDTEVVIYSDFLKPLKDYDVGKGLLNECVLTFPEMQWENTSTYRLTPLNQVIARDGFNIKVLNFSNKSALISTSYNLSTKNGTLLEGNSIVFNFKIGNEYKSVKLLGKNISNNAAEIILQMPARNCFKRSYPFIFKSSSESIKLGFLIPVNSEKTYAIIARASGRDREGLIYNSNSSATISLSKTFSIRKIASNSILGERLYPESYEKVGDIVTIKNITYVTIRVDNLRKYPLYGVRLVDNILPSFDFLDDANRTSISWIFDINGSDHKEFTYAITAKRQGVYTLPEAELIWNEWGEKMVDNSNSPRSTVSGPYINIARSLDKNTLNIGDTLQVTLSITNNGDLPTNVTVEETVPENSTFLSGKLYYSGFLNPGESASIAYNVSVHKGTVEFKAPLIKSTNQGFEWYETIPVNNIAVPSVEVTAFPEVTTALDVEMPQQLPKKGIFQLIDERFPWLEGTISIMMFLFAIILLFAINKMNIK